MKNNSFSSCSIALQNGVHVLPQGSDVLRFSQESPERREVQGRVALTDGLAVRAGDERVRLVLHGPGVAAVAEALLPRDAAPPPRLHLQAVRHEAEAADRRPDVVRDVQNGSRYYEVFVLACI